MQQPQTQRVCASRRFELGPEAWRPKGGPKKPIIPCQ
jgi:hypothetical protein